MPANSKANPPQNRGWLLILRLWGSSVLFLNARIRNKLPLIIRPTAKISMIIIFQFACLKDVFHTLDILKLNFGWFPYVVFVKDL